MSNFLTSILVRLVGTNSSKAKNKLEEILQKTESELDGMLQHSELKRNKTHPELIDSIAEYKKEFADSIAEYKQDVDKISKTKNLSEIITVREKYQAEFLKVTVKFAELHEKIQSTTSKTKTNNKNTRKQKLIDSNTWGSYHTMAESFLNSRRMDAVKTIQGLIYKKNTKLLKDPRQIFALQSNMPASSSSSARSSLASINAHASMDFNSLGDYTVTGLTKMIIQNKTLDAYKINTADKNINNLINKNCGIKVGF